MLRPFDVIMTWPNKFYFISWIISQITRGGPSHVRVYTKGLYQDFDFWEVTWPKVRWGYMDEIDPRLYRIEYGRHSQLFYPLPDELARRGLLEMIRLEGSLYDIGELAFSQFFDEIGVDHTDQSDPTRFVCSSGAEHILAQMGFPFCASDMLVSPQDIRRSPVYVKVRKEDSV